MDCSRLSICKEIFFWSTCRIGALAWQTGLLLPTCLAGSVLARPHRTTKLSMSGLLPFYCLIASRRRRKFGHCVHHSISGPKYAFFSIVLWVLMHLPLLPLSARSTINGATKRFTNYVKRLRSLGFCSLLFFLFYKVNIVSKGSHARGWNREKAWLSSLNSFYHPTAQCKAALKECLEEVARDSTALMSCFVAF